MGDPKAACYLSPSFPLSPLPLSDTTCAPYLYTTCAHYYYRILTVRPRYYRMQPVRLLVYYLCALLYTTCAPYSVGYYLCAL